MSEEKPLMQPSMLATSVTVRNTPKMGGNVVMTCNNCGKPIDTYNIKPVWYHCGTGREQCNYEDLMDIRIAQPQKK